MDAKDRDRYGVLKEIRTFADEWAKDNDFMKNEHGTYGFPNGVYMLMEQYALHKKEEREEQKSENFQRKND